MGAAHEDMTKDITVTETQCCLTGSFESESILLPSVKLQEPAVLLSDPLCHCWRDLGLFCFLGFFFLHQGFARALFYLHLVLLEWVAIQSFSQVCPVFEHC